MPGFDVNGGFYGFTASTPSIQPYDTLEFSDDVTFHARRSSDLVWHGLHQPEGLRHQLSEQSGRVHFRRLAHRLRSSPAQGLADYLLGYTSATAALRRTLRFLRSSTKMSSRSTRRTPGKSIAASPSPPDFAGIHFSDTRFPRPRGQISLPDIINDVHSTKFPTAPAGYLFSGDPGGPCSNKLTNNALDKWSPRIGVAWDPEGNGRHVGSRWLRHLL